MESIKLIEPLFEDGLYVGLLKFEIYLKTVEILKKDSTLTVDEAIKIAVGN